MNKSHKGRLNSSEEALVRFVQAVSPHLHWPHHPPSDLDTKTAVVFNPDRVQKISEMCKKIDIQRALEHFGTDEENAHCGPTTTTIAEYLTTVFSLWELAASQGEGVVFSEF